MDGAAEKKAKIACLQESGSRRGGDSLGKKKEKKRKKGDKIVRPSWAAFGGRAFIIGRLTGLCANGKIGP